MSKIITTEDIIKESILVHGHKYDYSKTIYNGSKNKMCIICPDHGEFWQIPYNHLNGKGCPICGIEKMKKSKTSTSEEFIKKANNVHKGKYEYNKVDYKNSQTKVIITCSKHGDFLQSPFHHLQGQGCPLCQKEKLSSRMKFTTQRFIDIANIVHNNYYSYEYTDYKDIWTKVIITCPQHGNFEQTPDNHLRGHGCPKCNQSHLEEFVENILKENNIEYIPQYKDCTIIGLKSIDFYLPKQNIAIECQGEQHFKSVDHFGGNKTLEETIRRDLDKFNELKDNEIKVIYVADKLYAKHLKEEKFNGIYNENVIFKEDIENNTDRFLQLL